MKRLAHATNNEIAQSVRLRNQVDKKLENNYTQAYEIAKSIKHPWYKCQALSAVADKTSNTSIDSILEQAFNSAMQCHDQNRRVTVACWPLWVAIRHDRTKLISGFLKQCTIQINQEMDPLSKWCACDVLCTIKSKPNLLNDFYDTFASATTKGHGWRIERMIKFLLSDKDIQSDPRYITHLEIRQNQIAAWKQKHATR
ncbi:hypothetical protein ACTSKR_05270 [Chitinibacteraceae bacterium HSL-7]